MLFSEFLECTEMRVTKWRFGDGRTDSFFFFFLFFQVAESLFFTEILKATLRPLEH